MFYTAQQESHSLIRAVRELIHLNWLLKQRLTLKFPVKRDTEPASSEVWIFFILTYPFAFHSNWILPLLKHAQDVYSPSCVPLQNFSSLNLIDVCPLLFSILMSLRLKQDQYYHCPPFKSFSEPWSKYYCSVKDGGGRATSSFNQKILVQSTFLLPKPC